jgi:preprotein translocase subunit SecD
MGKNLGIRTWSIVAVLLIFIYGIFYGMNLPHKGSLKSLLAQNIHLGLDLKGGTHLVMEVHVDEAVNSSTDRDVQRLDEALSANGAKATKLDPKRSDVITVTGGTAAQQTAIHDVITGTDYASYDVASTPDGTGYTMTLKQAAIRDIKDRTLTTSIDTIRERIDALGTLDPVIEKYGIGENEIVLELPGISDPEEVRKLIEATPKLEIHPVVGTTGYPSLEQATTAAGGIVPSDEEIVSGSSGAGGPEEFYIVKRATVVSGTDFRDAQPSTDENGRPDLSFTLTTDAGERFFNYTSANINSMMAITLGTNGVDKVIEAANIQSAIHDQGRITGGLTQAQAVALSAKLRSGSLPASITPTETQTVGPSLGAASIRAGVNASIAGMVVVMIFLLVYYRGAGVNAVLALIMNLVLLLGFMGFNGATLTLPGIAGVILTIGMGVDSNVLIFERIREELRLGKSASAAIGDSFTMQRALGTIVDTHVTTVVSALILFIFGTGPVKGFAVTLTVGLLANIFTAVFVSRTIFDFVLNKKDRNAALSI